MSGSYGKTIRVWDASSGDLKHTANMSETVRSLALSRDGRKLVFACWDGLVGVRRFPNINETVCDVRLHEYILPNEYGIYRTFVAINGKGCIVASGTHDGNVRIWDGDTGASIGSVMRGHRERINSIAISSNGSRIASGGGDGVFVWDAKRCIVLAGSLDDSNDACSMALSADESRIAVGHTDGDISIYDAHTCRPACRRLRGHMSYVSSVALCLNGLRLVTGSEDNTVRLWNCDDGLFMSTLENAIQG